VTSTGAIIRILCEKELLLLKNNSLALGSGVWFIRVLGFPAISVPMVNFDNNQHSENETLRLGHLWKGIVTMAALLTMDPK
jgi:hypothetical protein